MRNAFARQLTEMAAEDERIVLLSGDIGNRLFNDFKARCPGRFFNCGVAEANMMSVAAGMALCGLKPIVYTIVPFVTTRCLEQIRVDVCYHDVPVTIVGTGGGLSYASLGATHQSCEDIALLRVLPNMTVVCPADSCEVRLALKEAVRHDGPVYLRIGKKGEPDVHDHEPDFAFGKGIVVREGDQVALLATGNMVAAAVEAADILLENKIPARVVSMHTIKPLDAALLDDVFRPGVTVVATVEEHSRLGGLGGAVAEWLTGREGPHAPLVRIGTPDAFPHEAGNQLDTRQRFGLDAQSIANTILECRSSRVES